MPSPDPKLLNVHLVGIGGAGMSALAQLLLEGGSRVSGSDARLNPVIESLRAARAQITIGHRDDLREDVERVIHSPTIPSSNPELRAARRRGLVVQSRAAALAEFLEGRETICVAGSHGKTTTTAMLAFVLQSAGVDPGFMVGGGSSALGGRTAKIGRGPFVLEACEAFGALAHWKPSHAIVTNVDDEHLEHYGGRAGLTRGFAYLMARVPEGGALAVCGDDPDLLALATETAHCPISFGLESHNLLRGEIAELATDYSSFWVFREGRRLGRVRLGVPGLHNIRNALGVLAIAQRLGVSFRHAGGALSDFRGVDRRWQFVGEANGVRVFDDYAHHPAEIAATISVARRVVGPKGKLVVGFEPQLHSRVTRLASEFAGALAQADLVAVAPVDAAGETHPATGTAALSNALDLARVNSVRVGSIDEMATALAGRLGSGDVFVTFAPGRISQVGAKVLEMLQLGEPGSHSSAVSISLGPRTASPALLIDQFVAHVAATPDAPAISCGQATLTYRELHARACGLAERLIAGGVAREKLVAVRLAPSVDRVVAFVGVLMAGGVFMPVDPVLPRARVTFMLKDARAQVLIDCDDQLTDVPIDRLSLSDIVSPTSDLSSIRPAPSDAAYVIYTSGTTGTAKGVAVEHAALANFAAAACDVFGITGRSRVSLVSAFGFDVSVGDMAMALYCGASLHTPADDLARSGPLLGRFVREARLTHLSMTPSALSTLPKRLYPMLSHIIVAGETCPTDLAERFSGEVRFFNAYGPTEATVFSTVDECRSGEPVTIGRAFANTDAFILDEARRPVAIGVTGELWLAGAGLALGYLGQPALTAERFPFLSNLGNGPVRAYRTGDLAHMLPDGRISFCGRADGQIKRRGFRIEPEEIEATLRRLPGIDDAAVALRKDEAGQERLVAYIGGARHPPSDEIERALRDWLPAYMLPDAIVPVAAIPLSPNGKRDVSALPLPPVVMPMRAIKAAANEIELGLVELIRTELEFEGEFGIRDTFADLGLDSLKVATLFMLAETRFDIELSAKAMGEAETVEILALQISALRESSPRAAPADRSLAEGIRRKQLAYLSGWAAPRRTPESLIVLHGPASGRPPLYWCCQSNQEHQALAHHVDRRQVHGMRSGHLIFSYSPDSIVALAALYADEMMEMQPSGSFRLGGNCQGGTIAREVALQLRARGREVALLCLMEQGRFPAYDSRVALIFGEMSDLNPYACAADPETLFSAAYGENYSVDLLPGRHGNYFASPTIKRLADVIENRVSAVDHL